MSMQARTALLAGLLIAGCCAGCASKSQTPNAGAPPQGPGTPAPAVTSTTVGNAPGNVPDITGGQCPTDSTDPAVEYIAATASTQPSGVPLSPGFKPVAAVRCETQIKTVPGDGVWQVAVAQRATSGLDPLITALRLPSSNPPDGIQIPCAAVGFVAPEFALVDAQGRTVQPSLPHDVCENPLTRVLDALNALPWKTETEQNVSQMQTQAELDTGCPSGYKDVFELPTVASPAPGAAAPGAAALKPTAVCEYTMSATAPPKTGSIDSALFSHGLKLVSAQQSAIAAALAGSRPTPASACSAMPSRLAVLIAGTSGDLVVELDGCQRMLYPDDSAGQTPAALLSALAAVGIS